MVLMDNGNCPRKVFQAGLSAGTVNQGKGVISFPGQCKRMGEAVVDGSDVPEAAARTKNGAFPSGLPFEEE